MTILIIEDEELAVEKLVKTLRAVEQDADIVGVLNSVAASVKWLGQHPSPDIILMDIELADGQSFEIFNQAEVSSPVIFTTSYDEYAIRAFKVNSIDYLLKPVEEEDMRVALNKYHKLKGQGIPKSSMNEQVIGLVRELQQQLKPAGYRDRFLVKMRQQLVSVESGDIAYFFAEGRVCYFVTWDRQKYVLDYTLEELEKMMDPAQFFRANRSYLIHIKSVQQIHNYFNGKLKLRLKPPVEKDDVVVSREKAGEFKVWMGK